ncbi:helix-turn-helix domain-containing protein [Sphingobacterium sp. HJSM2_6]|uniref:helix-turn-helix domain-containing protein n=1 Tax=Sphingobacterium sp. HJSM2_6 TaxID=3366264 RepID=UPI003BC3FBB3
MKPSLFDVQSLLKNGIHVKEIQEEFISDQLHFHNAYEIAFIVKGHGRRIVGDSVNHFTDLDLTIMPPFMPHATYTEAKHHIITKDQSVHAIVVYFLPLWFDQQVFNAVEFARIKTLFSHLKRGIKVFDKQHTNIHLLMKALVRANPGIESLILMLQILKELSEIPQFDYLSSVFYTYSDEGEHIEKINKIYKYVMENFTNKITLEEVADIAFMTPPAFCKYFKQKTNKTFSNFVNEIRIGFACELLMNEPLDISKIAFHAGFNNFTSFNKNFKKFTKFTPSEFRNKLSSKRID